LTALVLAHMPVGQPALRHAGVLALRTALLGAPIMALLFVLFPRVGPLWGVPNDGTPTTGLSNSMHMGSVAEIAQDDSVAMRVRFLNRVPPPEAMYFRGPVLALFDGLEWRAVPTPRAMARFDIRVSGEPIRYEMTLEPQRLAVLPLLEATASPPTVEGYRVIPRDDLQWVTDRPVYERLRFEAQANTEFREGESATLAQLRDTLTLPPDYNPRTVDWAVRLRRDPRYADADARTLARAVMAHIRNGDYSYTLSPGTYGGNQPHGRHRRVLARSQARVLRALRVRLRRRDARHGRARTRRHRLPGDRPNPIDGYYIVRQSYAHAWAEYWQAGIGWTRIDPTAAVAPDRILRSRNLARPQGVVAGAFGNMSPELLSQMRDAWEAVNNRWNQWVLNYSRGQQLDLLKNLGFSSPSWKTCRCCSSAP